MHLLPQSTHSRPSERRILVGTCLCGLRHAAPELAAVGNNGAGQLGAARVHNPHRQKQRRHSSGGSGDFYDEYEED